MRDWDDDVYNMLAKKSISLDDDWDREETDALVEDHVIKDGTYAFLDTISAMNVEEKVVLAEKYKTHWFKSNETLMSEFPYKNWMVRKKWPLKEILILHVLHFQQAGFINSSINLYSQITFRRVCYRYMFPMIRGNGLQIPG